ncbi:MAG: hypothetical protein ACOCUL_02475 [Bacteroidota bacterium]
MKKLAIIFTMIFMLGTVGVSSFASIENTVEKITVNEDPKKDKDKKEKSCNDKEASKSGCTGKKEGKSCAGKK